MDDAAAPAFAQLLRQHRQAAGLTQEELAERAGLSWRAISDLERGVYQAPRRDTLDLLLRALALPADQRAALVAAARRAPATAAPAMRPDQQAAGDAPPSATHNLPVSLSALIGRERDLARVAALLDATRLVTLLGTGGIGKTRLALAVAEGLVDAYRDGIWLVELAALSDPELVPHAVASVLAVRAEAGRPLLATLIAHLKARQVLLVLDNCEHLLSACASLAAALLRACPDLRILATSRQALDVAGERRYRVPALAIPHGQHPIPPELAASSEAVRLFVARAQERRDDFALTAANARAVVEICARLDGVALAIELAAARIGSMDVSTIAARLDDRFKLLTGGSRDVPARQRTLRAALDWSWDLLEAPERSALAALAVFAGGCTLDAAEAVLGDEPTGSDRDVPAAPAAATAASMGWAVADVLDRLVDRSLVQVSELEDGSARYTLLESVREYAARRLEASGQAAAERDRHLAWCVALAEEAEPHLTGPQQAAWLARLEREHDNLRAALRWARQAGLAESGLRLAGALWRFWYTLGHLAEGRGWLEAALAAGDAVAPGMRARALNGAANLAQMLGEYGPATSHYEQALALFRHLGDSRGAASSLNGLGMVAQARGDNARAMALHEEALTLRRALGDRHGSALSLSNLGNAANDMGEYQRAAALHREALALRRALGDSHGIANTLNNLGAVACEQGDHPQAAALHEEALALRRAIGDRWGIATSLNNLGKVAQAQAEWTRAAELHREALALFRALADRHGIAASVGNLGDVACAQGDGGSATALYNEALAHYGELGDQRGTVEMLEGLARMAATAGRHRHATRLCAAAAALRQTLGAPRPPREQAAFDRLVASLRAALGEEAFDAAWEAGYALPLGAVISYT